MICSPPGACPENWPGGAYLSHTHKLQVQFFVYIHVAHVCMAGTSHGDLRRRRFCAQLVCLY